MHRAFHVSKAYFLDGTVKVTWHASGGTWIPACVSKTEPTRAVPAGAPCARAGNKTCESEWTCGVGGRYRAGADVRMDVRELAFPQ
jgi:hypothetical protein